MTQLKLPMPIVFFLNGCIHDKMKGRTMKTLFSDVLEKAVEYRGKVNSRSPYSQATTEDLRAAFDTGLPEIGRPEQDVLAHLMEAADPGLIGVGSNKFFAWVMGPAHDAGVAADWITSAWGQNAGIYQTSPAAAIAEEIAGKWLLDLLDLPRHSSFAFTSGATMSSFICLAAARSEVLRRAGYDLEKEGMFGSPQISVFVSEEAHSTISSDLRLLGFGENHLTKIKADDQGQMCCNDLLYKISNVKGPKIIICQAGHINSGAFDDFTHLADIANNYNAWMHVDGAFGLWARSSSKLRYLTEGIERADSWTVDGHKLLKVPYDSGYGIIKNPEAHRRAMSVTASYLNEEEKDGRNPTHYVPELSRRARGFTVWTVLQVLGRKGVAEHLEKNCLNAQYVALQFKSMKGVRVLNDVVLNQLAIVFKNDQHTLKAIQNLQYQGKWFVKEASWKGHIVMRLSFSSNPLERDDLDMFVADIQNELQKNLD